MSNEPKLLTEAELTAIDARWTPKGPEWKREVPTCPGTYYTRVNADDDPAFTLVQSYAYGLCVQKGLGWISMDEMPDCEWTSWVPLNDLHPYPGRHFASTDVPALLLHIAAQAAALETATAAVGELASINDGCILVAEYLDCSPKSMPNTWAVLTAGKGSDSNGD